jgi:hypothetical protein
MGFLGDYINVLPAVVAVINGALAVSSAHYPFKTPKTKLRFVVLVILLLVPSKAGSRHCGDQR